MKKCNLLINFLVRTSSFLFFFLTRILSFVIVTSYFFFFFLYILLKLEDLKYLFVSFRDHIGFIVSFDLHGMGFILCKIKEADCEKFSNIVIQFTIDLISKVNSLKKYI